MGRQRHLAWGVQVEWDRLGQHDKHSCCLTALKYFWKHEGKRKVVRRGKKEDNEVAGTYCVQLPAWVRSSRKKSTEWFLEISQPFHIVSDVSLNCCGLSCIGKRYSMLGITGRYFLQLWHILISFKSSSTFKEPCSRERTKASFDVPDYAVFSKKCKCSSVLGNTYQY